MFVCYFQLKSGNKTSKFSSFQDPSLADGKVIIDLIDCLKPKVVDDKLVRDEATAEVGFQCWVQISRTCQCL